MTNREQFEALDKMIGVTLAGVPTTRQNEDHLMAIEGSATAEVDEDERQGWISHDEHELIITAFHKRLHPDLSTD